MIDWLYKKSTSFYSILKLALKLFVETKAKLNVIQRPQQSYTELGI